MFIEPMEKNDWDVNPQDDNIVRKCKSIQAYWLNYWYEEMKDVTFETVFYNDISDIPDVLPFDKCMVRYENKSPKDSDYWGPISTKKELINLFYTSLRCKTNSGHIFCVRKWMDLGDEYRCFWNNGLVAVSAELELEPPIEKILEYIKKISPKIKFNRCVFDISHVANSDELIFVEYNSWESNSGAHRFNWLDDTEVLYDAKEITFKWLNGEKKIPLLNNQQGFQSLSGIAIENFSQEYPQEKLQRGLPEFVCYLPVKPSNPSNWLVTDKHIYIANDIWLGRFSLDFKPINWTRGVFRFNSLLLCEDGCIFAEPNFYYYDLTPKKTKSKLVPFINDDTFTNRSCKYKYGIDTINKETGKRTFIRISSNCNLILTE